MPAAGGVLKRPDLLAALFVYVLPLLAVSGLLALSGLGGLALALLAVEACVVTATVFAKRRPAPTHPRPPSSRPWLVPLAMVAVLAGILGIAVLGARSG